MKKLLSKSNVNFTSKYSVIGLYSQKNWPLLTQSFLTKSFTELHISKTCDFEPSNEKRNKNKTNRYIVIIRISEKDIFLFRLKLITK